jgi:GNAT superfamily N-acetyltransferase
MTTELVCWEALDAAHPTMAQARRLYEATQPLDEQIPYGWISGAVGRRKDWRPGRWATHLHLAGPRGAAKEPETVTGFANSLHLPGYGGYLTYVGVEPAARGRGVGARLVRLAVRALQVDAWCEGGDLPFVVWESRPPSPGEDASAWRAKLGLWRRVGARWVSGLVLHTTNYSRPDAPPLRLALFLLPVARPAEGFDDAALRDVVAGLLGEVYDCEPGDECHSASLPPDRALALRPAEEAEGVVFA